MMTINNLNITLSQALRMIKLLQNEERDLTRATLDAGDYSATQLQAMYAHEMEIRGAVGLGIVVESDWMEWFDSAQESRKAYELLRALGFEQEYGDEE